MADGTEPAQPVDFYQNVCFFNNYFYGALAFFGGSGDDGKR